jgi:hypothetical protein
MSYNSTVHSAARACKASRRAVIELINSIYTLGHTQTSCIPILRYMALAYCYDIRYVIVGQNPYPSDIVPHFGSAYSQCDNSVDTPTTRIICEHFDGSDVNDVYIRDMIRNNWMLLESGYLFVNSDFARDITRSPIESLRVYDQMVEYLYHVCVSQKPCGFDSSIHIIGLGTAAHHIAVTLASRLRACGYKAISTLDGQPARLTRLTCGAHRIGKSDAYSCLSCSTKKLFRLAAYEWHRVQGVGVCHRSLDNMSDTIATVFMTTISGIIEDLSTHISNAPVIPADPVDMTGELTIEIGKHSQETTKLLYHLACALAADTGVKQTISEKIIASAAANSQFKRPTQSVVSSGVQMPIISSGASVNTVQSGLTPKSLTPSVSKAISSKLKSYTTPSKSSATSATTSPVILIPVVQSTPTVTVSSGVCNTPTPVISTSTFARFKTPQRSITRSDVSIISSVNVVVQEPDKPRSGVFGNLPRVDLSE